MNLGTLRSLFTLFFILSHIGTFLILFFMWYRGGLTGFELQILIMIITPPFLIYSGIAFNSNFISSPTARKNSRIVSKHNLVFTIIPIIFSLFASSLASIYSFNLQPMHFNDLVQYIGIIEAAFAGYLSTVINKLFVN